MSGRISTVLSAVVFLAAQAVSAAPPFDQGVDVRPILELARENAKLPDPGEPVPRVVPESPDDFVWISVANDDVEALGEDFSFPQRQAVGKGADVSVYKVQANELDHLSHLMHTKLNRCGGFFTHRSYMTAQTDLSAITGASGARTYSIDQEAWVGSMLGLIRESRITGDIQHLEGYHNRYYTSDTGRSSSQWLLGHWSDIVQGRSDISVEAFSHSWAQDSVIMTVHGSVDPSKVVVLGGHLDSIAGYWGGSRNRAPGADDNASGIAVLTEAARVIVESGYRPAYTVKLIAYAAEEVGLRGSRAIADQHKSNGVDVQGVLQFDMSNYQGSAGDIYLTSDYTDADQNAYLGRLIDAYTDLTWGYTSCGYGCSDHASWTRNGFPASFPIEAEKNDANPYIHSSKDTLAQSGGDSWHAVKFTQLAVAYLAEMGKSASMTARLASSEDGPIYPVCEDKASAHGGGI